MKITSFWVPKKRKYWKEAEGEGKGHQQRAFCCGIILVYYPFRLREFVIYGLIRGRFSKIRRVKFFSLSVFFPPFLQPLFLIAFLVESKAFLLLKWKFRFEKTVISLCLYVYDEWWTCGMSKLQTPKWVRWTYNFFFLVEKMNFCRAPFAFGGS